MKTINLFFLLIGIIIFAQETKFNEIPQFASTGMGNESMQFFAPLIHTIDKDVLIFKDASGENNEDIVFRVEFIENNWDYKKENGEIIVQIFNDTIQTKGTYIINFKQEKPFISLQYKDSQLILFSNVSLYNAIKEED